MAKTNSTAKTKNKAEAKPTRTPNSIRTIDQMSFARQIAQKYGFKISDVLTIIEAEQKLTMEYVKMGYKVIKKNYITLESRKVNGKKNWISPLNGKTYDIAPTTRILVRIGDGFKKFIDNKKMPEKLCRFVESTEACMPASE